jgi:hypothetical protein
MRCCRKIILVAFVLLPGVLFCQKDKYQRDSISICSYPKTYIELNYSASITDLVLSLPFRNILSFDVRLDTTCFAVLGDPMKRYDVSPSLSAAVTTHLNASISQNLAPAREEQLLIFIKQFRIATYDSVSKIAKFHHQSLRTTAEIESYYCRDSVLYPAFRLDTTFYTATEDIENLSQLIKPVTDAVLVKAFKMKAEKVVLRKKYSFPEIMDSYNERKLTDFGNTTPVRGLYTSIAEFRHNKPLISDFTVKYKKGNFSFYSKNDSLILGKVMIYSDGSRLWINTPEGFLPLIRNNHRYEYFGYVKWITRSVAPGASPGTITDPQIMFSMATTIMTSMMGSADNADRGLHYLDIDTGEIY